MGVWGGGCRNRSKLKAESLSVVPCHSSRARAAAEPKIMWLKVRWCGKHCEKQPVEGRDCNGRSKFWKCFFYFSCFYQRLVDASLGGDERPWHAVEDVGLVASIWPAGQKIILQVPALAGKRPCYHALCQMLCYLPDTCTSTGLVEHKCDKQL